jgi:hypothetical protein
LGHKFSLTASAISVKELDITAWQAIMAAIVAIPIPNIKNHDGIIW